jgi:hypothetical protein
MLLSSRARRELLLLIQLLLLADPPAAAPQVLAHLLEAGPLAAELLAGVRAAATRCRHQHVLEGAAFEGCVCRCMRMRAHVQRVAHTCHMSHARARACTQSTHRGCCRAAAAATQPMLLATTSHRLCLRTARHSPLSPAAAAHSTAAHSTAAHSTALRWVMRTPVGGAAPVNLLPRSAAARTDTRSLTTRCAGRPPRSTATFCSLSTTSKPSSTRPNTTAGHHVCEASGRRTRAPCHERDLARCHSACDALPRGGGGGPGPKGVFCLTPPPPPPPKKQKLPCGPRPTVLAVEPGTQRAERQRQREQRSAGHHVSVCDRLSRVRVCRSRPITHSLSLHSVAHQGVGAVVMKNLCVSQGVQQAGARKWR